MTSREESLHSVDEEKLGHSVLPNACLTECMSRVDLNGTIGSAADSMHPIMLVQCGMNVKSFGTPDNYQVWLGIELPTFHSVAPHAL